MMGPASGPSTPARRAAAPAKMMTSAPRAVSVTPRPRARGPACSYFTAFFSPAPAVKRGTFAAAIEIFGPEGSRGFTPWRAARLLT